MIIPNHRVSAEIRAIHQDDSREKAGGCAGPIAEGRGSFHRMPSIITDHIWAEVETFFGPTVSLLKGDYRVTEVIDDVCILQPIRPLTTPLRLT